MSPDNHMQHADQHKVLGRGRGRFGIPQVSGTRVLMVQRAVAYVGRQVTPCEPS
jgi:hypothetical protein